MSVAFVNGRIFDGTTYQGPGTVVIEDGHVTTVQYGECLNLPAGAEVVDVQGGLVLPGFIDAHMHPMVGGLEQLRCELNKLSTREEYLDAIAEHAGSEEDHGWFRAGGWAVGAFPAGGPLAADLDQVLGDRPAFIVSSDHHNAWANTAALRLAGVSAATPDPPDGWVERDEHGRPTGALREAAMSLVFDCVRTTREGCLAGLLQAQDYLHAGGITGWHDALIGGYAGIDDPTQAYLDAIDQERLTARVRASQWWDRNRGPEQVAELVERRARLLERGLDAGSVKLMVDGIAETFTASVTEPYADLRGCPCGGSGLSFLDHDDLVEAAVALVEAGFQLHFHAIGDRAVHDALDAVQAAGPARGRRHQIAHLQLVRPEDRPRFAALGVVANLEGMWVNAASGSVALVRPHLDDERFSWHYPFAEIARHGAELAGGSDWPVNPPEPVGAVHALVNRRPYGQDLEDGPDPLFPEEGLTLQQALTAYTRGS
ncbi:MAG: amidohydrolase, partial [Nocardioidaceae bacterium]